MKPFCAPLSVSSRIAVTSIPRLPISRAKPVSPTAPSISTSKAKKTFSTPSSIAALKKHSTPRENRSPKSQIQKKSCARLRLLHLERLGADRDLAVVFQVELRGSTKFMEEFSAAGFAEYLTLIRSTFEEGQRAGIFRADLNAKVVAKILFGALDEMATNWILSKRRYKLAPMADEVLDIFLNGVKTQ